MYYIVYTYKYIYLYIISVETLNIYIPNTVFLLETIIVLDPF